MRHTQLLEANGGGGIENLLDAEEDGTRSTGRRIVRSDPLADVPRSDGEWIAVCHAGLVPRADARHRPADGHDPDEPSSVVHEGSDALDSANAVGQGFRARRDRRRTEVVLKKFMLTATAAAVLLGGMATAVLAKTFELPDGKPVVTIDLPNAWSPEEIEKGAQATSPDTSIYIAFEVSNLKNTEKVITDGVKFFAESGVKIDPKTQKKTEAKINGLDVIDLGWDGIDKDGPTKVSLSVIVLSETKIGLLSYWGSPAGETKYAAQLKAIATSIQPLGR